MKSKKKRSLRSRAKAALRGGAATGGTVSLATLGLTTCDGNSGGGVVDPAPPPPLVCKDANQGQNLAAHATVDNLSLEVSLFNSGKHCCVHVDTVSVTNVVGATLDSLTVPAAYYARMQLALTLDSLSVTQVTFTLAGTWDLNSGPCDFQRTFTVTIDNGNVHVTQRERRLPLDVPRNVRIELVDRDGLRVNLRAALNGEGTPEWRVAAGKLERLGRLGVTWELPSEPGYYQIELSVDRGTRGIGFDALALEVS